jgi:hypothetical protein
MILEAAFLVIHHHMLNGDVLLGRRRETQGGCQDRYRQEVPRLDHVWERMLATRA